jgi:hypothetical protein
MYNRIFQQIALGRGGRANGSNSDDQKIDNVHVWISLKAEQERIAFSFKATYSNSEDQKYSKDKYHINITRNMQVIITLTDNLWFSNKYDAITLKENYSDLYYQMEYENDSFDQKVGRHRTICFMADNLVGGSSAFSHGFSLNIDLLVSGNRWIPITIDPDFKNPPPPPGRFTEIEKDDDVQYLSGGV